MPTTATTRAGPSTACSTERRRARPGSHARRAPRHPGARRGCFCGQTPVRPGRRSRAVCGFFEDPCRNRLAKGATRNRRETPAFVCRFTVSLFGDSATFDASPHRFKISVNSRTPRADCVGDSRGSSSAVRLHASFLNQPLKERLQWLPRRRARRRLRRRLLRRAARRPETSTSTSAKDFVVRLGVRSEPCFFSGPPAEALARVQPRADRLPAP